MPPTGPVHIQINVLGETQINRKMLRWSLRSGDFAPAFEAILEYLEKVEEKQFDSEGAYSGSPWAPLKESTLKAKERAGLDPRILHATLALRNSLTQSSAPEAIRIATPSMMVFGTTLPYARMHQQPGSAAPYPRRRPIDLTEKNKLSIMRTLQAWIVTGGIPEGRP